MFLPVQHNQELVADALGAEEECTGRQLSASEQEKIKHDIRMPPPGVEPSASPEDSDNFRNCRQGVSHYTTRAAVQLKADDI